MFLGFGELEEPRVLTVRRRLEDGDNGDELDRSSPGVKGCVRAAYD